MPYLREGKCVYKKNSDGSKGEKAGCSETEEKAKAHMRALYAAENKSLLSEMSMAIVKASREKSDGTMRIRMVNSDTGEDVFGEKMSLELFQDFVERSDNNEPVPPPFDEVVEKTEHGYWTGGPPYLSVAHYKSGAGKNVPGHQEKLYIDGEKLKSVDVLDNTELGNAVWKAIYNDLYEEDKRYENPVRVSIGFLDLQHLHEGTNVDGSDFVFTRNSLSDKCEMCEKNVGNKVYLKGHLVHKAFTRVPANVRTLVEVDEMTEKSGIVTKKDDARSIIDDLAEELEEKSALDDVLVIRSEKDYRQYANQVEMAFSKKFAPKPEPKPYLYAAKVSDKYLVAVEEMYTEGEGYSDKIYKIGYKDDGDGNFTFDKRSDWTEMEYGLMPKKSQAGEEWEVEFDNKPSKEVEKDKSEVEMEKNQVQEPVVEEPKAEEVVVEEPKAVATPAEKSAIDESVEALRNALKAVKEKGLTGEAALKEIQPTFNKVGDAVKAEVTPKIGDANMAEIIRSAVAEGIAEGMKALQGQMVAQAAKTVTPAPTNDGTVVRSLNVNTTQNPIQPVAPTGDGGRKLTQIERIAQESVK